MIRISLLLPTLIFMAATQAQGGELSGIMKNNEGVKKFIGKGGDGTSGEGGQHSFEAFGDFTGALADLPYSDVVHFNVGNSFMRNKEYEKALSEFKEAVTANGGAPASLSAVDREAHFRALFNSGVALTELKRKDEALDAYQAALEIDPTSVETKTNIELITAQGGGEGEGDDKDKDPKDQKNKDGKGGGKDQDKDKKKDDKDKKDKDDKGDKKDEKKPQQPDKVDNPKPSPHPFKSDDLSQQDVKRILEELKRQEEQIRTRMENDQQSKEAPPGKDW